MKFRIIKTSTGGEDVNKPIDDGRLQKATYTDSWHQETVPTWTIELNTLEEIMEVLDREAVQHPEKNQEIVIYRPHDDEEAAICDAVIEIIDYSPVIRY